MADRLTDTEVEVLDELPDYEPGFRRELIPELRLGSYLRGLEVDIDAAGGGTPAAEDVTFDNVASGLTATDVQAAIDEVDAAVPADASEVDYDNAVSGLAATDVQAAIDEVAAAASGGTAPTIVVTDVATYAVQNGDDYVLSTRSLTGAQSIVLPAIADHLTKVLVIADRGRNATQNPITVTPDGAETINGQALFIITQDANSLTLVGAGSEWTIV